LAVGVLRSFNNEIERGRHRYSTQIELKSVENETSSKGLKSFTIRQQTVVTLQGEEGRRYLEKATEGI
jgi:hypothetical protein